MEKETGSSSKQDNYIDTTITQEHVRQPQKNDKNISPQNVGSSTQAQTAPFSTTTIPTKPVRLEKE